jgi:uncharacterized membrane protein
MFEKIKKHRSLISIFVLLITASAISLFLAAIRMSRSDSARYGFLLWNLMLAWIPFLFAGLAYVLANIRKRFLYLMVFVSALAWLIFFPNAPYILTDFQHLSYEATDAIPVWYDVILLIWFAWTGLLLGVISLYLMQEIIKRMLGKHISWVFVLVVTLLSSFGVYVGRFMRWNSWDVWHRPIPLLLDILDQLRHPLANKDTYVFTIIFALLFLFIYITITLFGNLAAERQKANSNTV